MQGMQERFVAKDLTWSNPRVVLLGLEFVLYGLV